MAPQGKFSSEPQVPSFAPAMTVPDGASVAQTASRCSANAPLIDGHLLIVLAKGRRVSDGRDVETATVQRAIQPLDRP